MPDVQQQGTISPPASIQAIIPAYNFSCNGRVTGYLVSLERENLFIGDFPRIQIWRPTSSTVYSRVGTVCDLTASDISRMTDNAENEYRLGNVSCTGNSRIEFQSGDVIGYHQGSTLRYRLWNIGIVGYTSYHLDRFFNTLDTIDISSVDDTFSDRQPLIHLMYGKPNNTTIIMIN